MIVFQQEVAAYPEGPYLPVSEIPNAIKRLFNKDKTKPPPPIFPPLKPNQLKALILLAQIALIVLIIFCIILAIVLVLLCFKKCFSFSRKKDHYHSVNDQTQSYNEQSSLHRSPPLSIDNEAVSRVPFAEPRLPEIGLRGPQSWNNRQTSSSSNSFYEELSPISPPPLPMKQWTYENTLDDKTRF